MCRKDAGIGLREFARKLGVSSAYICRVEKDRDYPPSAKMLEKMEDILELPRGTLVAEANKVPSDFVKAFTKNKENTEMLPRFMRIVNDKKLTKEDWDRIIEAAKGETDDHV
jgi:transcriptional regulator with XRE-family HTH domain